MGRIDVLHVVDSLERGGLERMVVDLAIAQRRRGQGAAVFSLNATEGLVPELQAAGVPVVIGGKSRGLELAVLRSLRRSVLGFGTQVVHAHSFVPAYHAAAALCGLRRRIGLVATCHDMGQRLARRRLRWRWRWALRHLQGVAMVGRQVHEHYLSSGLVPAHKAVVVSNGIPLLRFPHGADDRAEARHAARAALGLPGDVLVIGCVGRLVALKNHRLVLSVLPALLARWPALRLVLVGGGECEAALRAQAAALGVAPQVLFAGVRADVAQLLPAFDVFVLPSLTEGLSIALLEAAACALPIVASAVGGNPEIVHSGDTGLLVPPDDATALHEALDHLLSRPQARRAMGLRARAWVQDHGSIDVLCEAYDAFYRRCAGHGAAAR
jgi:glycosyltransferase involved in cell wall biosynthesis